MLAKIPLLLAGLIAIACGPSAGPPPQGEVPGAASETPKRGGVLHFPIRQAQDSIDPFSGSGVSPRVLGEPRYEPLIVYRQGPDLDARIDFEVQPWLLERWERQDDTSYTFRLRKGVKWQDGQDFTANDVAFTIQWVSEPKNLYRARNITANIASADVVDPSTLKVQLKRKDAGFLSNLRDLYMLPKHVADRGESFDKVSIGTGPFKLAAFDARAGWALERNPNYWDAPRPHLDGVVGHYGLDDSGMLAAFVSRQTDLLTTDPPGLGVVRQTVPDVQVNKFQADYGQSMYMKLDRAPFSDVRVRKAIHLALDRQAMLQAVTSGEGAINPPGITGHKKGYAIPPEELLRLPGYNPTTKQQDIQEAKRLLAEAGHPNGFRETMIFSKSGTAQTPIAEVIATQLKASVGIDLVLSPLDAAISAQRDARGDYSVQIQSLFRMDMNLKERFRSGEPLNSAGINDPDLDRIIDAMNASEDAAQVKKLARDAQMLLLEKMYIIPTVEIASFPLAQAWVRNYSFGWGNPHATPYWFGSDNWLDVSRMPENRRTETPRISGR